MQMNKPQVKENKDMEGIEYISFQIISTVGTARSMYIEAIQHAKAKEFDKALDCIKQGDEAFTQGHKVHGELIQKEAAGERTEICLLLMHAEDQLMSAEGFKIIAGEIIEVYKTIYTC